MDSEHLPSEQPLRLQAAYLVQPQHQHLEQLLPLRPHSVGLAHLPLRQECLGLQHPQLQHLEVQHRRQVYSALRQLQHLGLHRHPLRLALSRQRQAAYLELPLQRQQPAAYSVLQHQQPAVSLGLQPLHQQHLLLVLLQRQREVYLELLLQHLVVFLVLPPQHLPLVQHRHRHLVSIVRVYDFFSTLV